jgi:hypothetical protein
MVGHGGVAVAFILAPFGGPGVIHTHDDDHTMLAIAHCGRLNPVTLSVYLVMLLARSLSN